MQRRGRAGRVQPGECYRLYPRCVYDAFAEYQLPEILRTPLQSLCLQIKSLRLGTIAEFLSRALQSPELLAVRVNLTHFLCMLACAILSYFCFPWRKYIMHMFVSLSLTLLLKILHFYPILQYF